MKLQNPGAFFTSIRTVTGPLNQIQVDVVNRMLADASDWKISWLAYAFATAWHEARLIPQKEFGLGKGKPYGKPGRNHGQIAYGRGLAQVTWDSNYEAVDKLLGLKGALIANYDLMLNDEIAVKALLLGMKNGTYTGVSLAKYLPDPIGSGKQFVAARRIINIQDRADLIAGYALNFQSSLNGNWG